MKKITLYEPAPRERLEVCLDQYGLDIFDHQESDEGYISRVRMTYEDLADIAERAPKLRAQMIADLLEAKREI